MTIIITGVLLATIFVPVADLAKAHAHFKNRPLSSSQTAVALLLLREGRLRRELSSLVAFPEII